MCSQIRVLYGTSPLRGFGPQNDNLKAKRVKATQWPVMWLEDLPKCTSFVQKYIWHCWCKWYVCSTFFICFSIRFWSAHTTFLFVYRNVIWQHILTTTSENFELWPYNISSKLFMSMHRRRSKEQRSLKTWDNSKRQSNNSKWKDLYWLTKKPYENMSVWVLRWTSGCRIETAEQCKKHRKQRG